MEVKQIDISGKSVFYREASAEGLIRLKPETVEAVKEGRLEKGNVLQIASLAGIQASKLTPLLVPLCHQIPIEKADVTFEVTASGVKVHARVVSTAKTGVEMEAVTCVLVSLLSIWDVTKRYEKNEYGQYPTTEITGIRVVEKVKRAVGVL